MHQPDSTPAISIVIPLYNEQDNLKGLQEELHAALAGLDYEILFVDDGSIDETASRVEPRKEVRLLQLQERSGQSAAMYVGIQAAQGQVIALLDGDGQNNPADIRRLLAEIDTGADLVCGYRTERRDSLGKLISSRVANFVRSRFVGDGVRDTGCTLKAMRSECRAVLIPFNGMHRFIPALIKSAGYKIVEIPVTHRPRIAGVSKYGLRNRALKATIDMFGIRWLMSRQVKLKVK